ncbi:hypothetical protein FA13DRAFT_506196 [Coprinellus micaceus]|uniref:Uncharacterized protein n=1 Tax=Coprinellus micaceus TaxID=71717 RepID=A0A4Y7SC14_COPMI|nr:hypothetical protein FA13DRAFT_506196 [Coprinellus micaceus]
MLQWRVTGTHILYASQYRIIPLPRALAFPDLNSEVESGAGGAREERTGSGRDFGQASRFSIPWIGTSRDTESAEENGKSEGVCVWEEWMGRVRRASTSPRRSNVVILEKRMDGGSMYYRWTTILTELIDVNEGATAVRRFCLTRRRPSLSTHPFFTLPSRANTPSSPGSSKNVSWVRPISSFVPATS